MNLSTPRPAPLTRNDLNGCGKPGCRCAAAASHPKVSLTASCHPQVALVVQFDKATGELELICPSCSAWIAGIAVAGELLVEGN